MFPGRYKFIPVFACLYVLSAYYAWTRMFTEFAEYDDEGYFVMVHRAFAAGEKLYDQILTPYGPVSFFITAALAGFDPAAVTHESLRWHALGCWMAIAGAGAFAAWTLFRDGWLAALMFLSISWSLSELWRGPGHPQSYLLLVGMAVPIAVVGACAKDASPRWAAALGVLAGLMAMMKINIAAFAVLASALTYCGFSLHPWIRRFAYPCAVVLCVLAAPALLRTSLGGPNAFFAFAVSSSLLATAAILRMGRRDPVFSGRAGFAFLSGAATTALIVMAVTLLRGSTLTAMWNMSVGLAMRFSRSMSVPYREPSRFEFLIAGIAVFAAYSLLLRSDSLGARRWIAAIKLTAGSLLWLYAAVDARAHVAAALPLLWLSPAPARRGGPVAPHRVFLAVFAALFTLQAYPNAGEQVVWGSLFTVLAAADMVYQGIASVSEHLPSPGRPRFAATVALTQIVLLLALSAVMVRPTRHKLGARGRYTAPLPFEGARGIYVWTGSAANYRDIGRLIRENCDSLFSVPTLYSLNLWTGVPNPEPRMMNSWLMFTTVEDQERIWRKIETSGRSCVAVSEDSRLLFRKHATAFTEPEIISARARARMRQVGARSGIAVYRTVPATRASAP